MWFGGRSRFSTDTRRPQQSWRLPGTQQHSSPWPLCWLLLTSHKVQKRGCTSPPEGSPGQGTAKGQTSLQSPLHTISLSPNHRSPESAIKYPGWCQNVREQTEASSKQKKPRAQLTAATARVRDVNRRFCMAFTGAVFLQGLNTCVICAVLASLRLVLLRLLHSLFLAKQHTLY